MKFHSSESPPPHLDRRLQRRLLGYVGLIGLAMVALLAWQLKAGKQPAAQRGPSPDEMDYNVRTEPERPLKPDEVRILPHRHRPAEAMEELATERSADVNVNPAWLEGIEDNTLGIRHHEAEAFFHLLAKAKDIPVGELEASAEQDVLFVNLMSSPELYRGKLVTIVGEIGQLQEMPGSRSEPGLDRLYQAWILTADSGNHPYRVVASSLAPELTPGKANHRTVQVTGYFFKREGYEAQGGRLTVAPTLLAGRIALYVSPQAPPPVEHVVPWLIGIVSAIGLAMLATVVGFAVSDRRATRWRQLQGQSDTVDSVALRHADQRLSIEESLRRLAADEPLDDDADPTLQSNGHASTAADLPEELIDLPTPFPPTRPVKRWGDGA